MMYVTQMFFFLPVTLTTERVEAPLLERHKIEDVITKSSDSDESKTATFQLVHSNFRIPGSSSAAAVGTATRSRSSSQQRSSPPPLETASSEAEAEDTGYKQEEPVSTFIASVTLLLCKYLLTYNIQF